MLAYELSPSAFKYQRKVLSNIYIVFKHFNFLMSSITWNIFNPLIYL